MFLRSREDRGENPEEERLRMREATNRGAAPVPETEIRRRMEKAASEAGGLIEALRKIEKSPVPVSYNSFVASNAYTIYPC